MELWDAYDAFGRRTGALLTRGEPVPPGCFHVVAEVAVRHADGSLLVTRRDPRKPNFPGCWEIGAGGSVLAGESWQEGARRELREETGLEARALIPLFLAVRPENGGIYAGFLCQYDGSKDAVRLQEGETIGYRWLSPRELLACVERPDFTVSQRQRWRVFLHQLEKETEHVLLL